MASDDVRRIAGKVARLVGIDAITDSATASLLDRIRIILLPLAQQRQDNELTIALCRDRGGTYTIECEGRHLLTIQITEGDVPQMTLQTVLARCDIASANVSKTRKSRAESLLLILELAGAHDDVGEWKIFDDQTRVVRPFSDDDLLQLVEHEIDEELSHYRLSRPEGNAE